MSSSSDAEKNAGVARVECATRTDRVKFEYSAQDGFFLEQMDAPLSDQEVPSSRHILNITTGNEFQDGHVEMLRKCWCTQFYEQPVQYCPASFNSCLVRGVDGSVECYELSKTEYLLRGMWPIVLFWYGLLTLAWFCSWRGTQARAHVRRLMQGGCTRQGYDAILNTDMDDITENQGYRIVQLRRSAIKRRDGLRRMEALPELRWLARWLRGEEYDNMDEILSLQDRRPAPVTSVTNTVLLSMKVKSFMSEETNNKNSNHDVDPEAGGTAALRYSKSHPARINAPFDEMGSTVDPLQAPHQHIHDDDDEVASNEDDEDDNTCAICLKPLQQGDLIGDIDCNHKFHKTCLKEWLRRKNSCPLCQRKDIAELHQTQTTSTIGTNGAAPTPSSVTGSNDRSNPNARAPPESSAPAAISDREDESV